MPRSDQSRSTTLPRSSTLLKVVAFGGALTLVFGLALVVGGATGPLSDTSSSSSPTAGVSHGDDQGHGSAAPGPEQGAEPDVEPGVEPAVAGLASSQDGYTLRLERERLAAGRARLAFRVLGPDGRPVTTYEEQHERDLHLVVVRRDHTGFQHVHPRMAADGTWSVPVDLRPGVWRVVADTHPADGEPLVLATDLLVPGPFRPAGLGVDRRRAEVASYDVRLDGPALAGQETVLTARVGRGGEPVTDLQPYLGTHGHLVALRTSDLGYLHVHPEETGSGPTLRFSTTFPSAGRYRLYLDFRHDGVVRSAPFTVTVAAPDPEQDEETADHDH